MFRSTLTIRCGRRSCRRCSIDKPGVYPVLVNVNGTPDYGAPARLDDARFLLPVLGVPPEPAADSAADTLTAVVPPDTSKPVRLTMLWPLADRPRLRPSETEHVRTHPVSVPRGNSLVRRCETMNESHCCGRPHLSFDLASRCQRSVV